MDIEKQIQNLAKEIEESQDLFTAFGDPTRQYIILEMMKNPSCKGLRVNDIAKNSNLSRPALSHHLSILKRAGILAINKEGTKNYYHFDKESGSFKKMAHIMEEAQSILDEAKCQGGK